MQNKLLAFLREQDQVHPGDTVICAVSGGADSVAMLFAFYLLKEKLDIRLEAAHFNHHLRGEESDRDEAFVRQLCDRYDIPLHLGGARVAAGKKGLEAAARDARYDYLRSLDGKIATAHTADDNAETILMHLIRGTGLKGLGGIAPVQGKVFRPMLRVTRAEVEAFLEEWCLSHIEDSSNASHRFLRNRVRHTIMPLLRQENPKVAENLSQMALRLRLDEQVLAEAAGFENLPDVQDLRAMHPALRSRMLDTFLKRSGVREPEDSHIAMAQALVFSDNPSARARFPGGITIGRCYDRLVILKEPELPETVMLNCPGETVFAGFRVRCYPAVEIMNTEDTFTVNTRGTVYLRTRSAGDSIRLRGGTKSLKKLFIDRKIPAAQREKIPVLSDEQGVLGVYSIGVNLDRAAEELPAVTVRFDRMNG